ncbi:MAG: CBS domain-containing protein [Salinarchaeum sp.]
MFKSVRVGSLVGIPIKLDITLLIVLPAFTWLIGARITEIAGILSDVPRLSIDVAAISGGLMPWILGLAAAIGLFVGVTLHELGHSVVAIRYGYAIDSITLWLLGGLAQFTEQPREWTHEFWIAIAGPIVSVAIGVVSYLAVVILPSGLNAVSFVLGYLAVLNVTLAVFNMIPAFPLDGGRVLRALYHRSTTLARATEKAVRVGKVFAVILGIFGLLTFNIFMIAVAFFIYMAGSAEGRHTAIASVFEDVAVIEVMTPASEVTSVRPGLSVADLFDRMLDDRYSGYPVVEDGDIVGIVTLDDIKAVSPEDRETQQVRSIMQRDLTTISLDNTAMEAFTQLSRSQTGRLLVMDGDRFVGLITRTDIARAFEILKERRVRPSSEIAQVPLER